jgi:ATP-dependent DNA helicase RecG
MSNAFLNTPIEYLKNVGPQRADVLKKELHIFTYNNLLQYYPFRYVDKTKFYKVKEINADLPLCAVDEEKLQHTEMVGV